MLFVDDEKEILQLRKDLVESHGFCVLRANDGMEAVEYYRLHADEIALVILDVRMPRKQGGEAYLEIRGLNPRVKALFCTVYSSDTYLTSLFHGEPIAVLEKPLLLSAWISY